MPRSTAALSKVCHELLFWEPSLGKSLKLWSCAEPTLILFNKQRLGEGDVFAGTGLRNAGFTEHKDILQNPEIKKRHRQSTTELNFSWEKDNYETANGD